MVWSISRVSKLFIIIVLALSFLIVSGCGGKKTIETPSPEKRFNEIKQLYAKKKFDRVVEEIEVYLVAFSGTAKIDSAQLLLAEAHFQLKEYILAQSEYERLAEQFTSSPLIEEARYKSALCWQKISPKRELEQQQTQKAYDEYQAFLEEYPHSPWAAKAEEGLTACREKLAMKELDAANLYMKMGKFDAAIVYFDLIIDTYYSTEAEPLALLGKGIALTKLEDISAAKSAYNVLLTKFAGSKSAIEAGKKMKELELRK